MSSPSVNDQEQKPSSLEELRALLVTFALEYHMTLNNWGEDSLRQQASRENLLDHTTEKLRSHMEAVINKVIYVDGHKEYEPKKKSDVVAAASASALNGLIKRQNNRAKSYLEGEVK